MSYDKCMHGKSCGYDICPGEECEHFRGKPSPEAVIKSLETCTEPFSSCDDCAFGPIDLYNQSCINSMMQVAAEYLWEKYPKPGN